MPLYVAPELETTLAAQYAGEGALLPIARAVMDLALTLPDATLEPRKTYVSFNTREAVRRRRRARTSQRSRSTSSCKGVPGDRAADRAAGRPRPVRQPHPPRPADRSTRSTTRSPAWLAAATRRLIGPAATYSMTLVASARSIRKMRRIGGISESSSTTSVAARQRHDALER